MARALVAHTFYPNTGEQSQVALYQLVWQVYVPAIGGVGDDTRVPVKTVPCA